MDARNAKVGHSMAHMANTVIKKQEEMDRLNAERLRKAQEERKRLEEENEKERKRKLDQRLEEMRKGLDYQMQERER